mgnify:CR=1 FL=1
MRRSIISKMLATGLAAIVFGTAVPTVCAVTIVNSGVNVLKNDTYQLEGGAAYTELKISGTLGNQNIYFVEADPGSEDLYFKLGLGGGPSGTITSKATTLNTANAYHAAMNDNVIAAVNGGFFYQSKNLLNASDQYAGPQVSTQLLSVPRGILMTGGEILCSQQLFAESPSGAASNAFGITADGTAVIGCPQIGITLNNHTKNTNTTADGLNRLPVNDAVILYNERLASSNYAMSDAVDYVVAVDTDNKFYNGRTVTGTIVSVENAAGLSPGRIVITARGSGKTRLSGYSVGDRVSVTASFIGDHTDAAKVSIWNDVQEAIGSIHLPILNGSITSAYADYAYHYGSSAIAITFDGKVIISANDAYNAGGSAGLQFRHMDDFWVTNLNVKDMLLLDGGGSTSIVANLGSGLQFRNYAADSSGQRSVTNTMMLLAKNDNHINTLDYPANAGATNAAVTVSVQRTLGDSQGLYIQGWSVHGRGVKGYQYKINNTQWMDLNAEYSQFGTTYGEVIDSRAQALKMTLYGTASNGSAVPLTDTELIAFLARQNCSETRKHIVKTGLSLVGKVPYFWGGKSAAGWNDEWNTPKLVTAAGSTTSGTIRPFGLDCSGFTDWTYKTAVGVSLYGGTWSQWDESYAITADELLPGDLGFLMDADGQGWNHVLIFAGYGENGERMWVHSSGGEGVILNTPSYEASLSLRRPKEVNFEDSSVVPDVE